MFSLLRRGPSARWGGVFLKCWGGIPKSCTKTPTLYYRGLVVGPAARCGGVPKVAPEPSQNMVLHAVWLVALRLDGVVLQKVAP